MTIERMWKLGGVSRSGFYRMKSRSEGGIGTWTCGTPSSGSLWSGPVTAGRGSPGASPAGLEVNPKRVYRILREDNLLCVRKRKFVVTTDSNHGRKIYPNLAREMVLNGIDQLWVADITYIRLETGVRLSGGGPGRLLTPGDWLGTGSHAGRHINPFGARHGFEATAAQARPDPSLRPRLQYASTDYTGLLEQHGIRISMSRKGNP